MAEAKTAKKSAPKAKAPKAKVEAKTKVAKTVTDATNVAPKASRRPMAVSKTDFAVIMTGGKQYRVHEGQMLKIEKILGDHKIGDSLVFKEVLMKNEGDKMTLGTPTIGTASVHSTIIDISRYKTVDVIHYKQKSKYFKKYGHRQPYFEVRIDSIK